MASHGRLDGSQFFGQDLLGADVGQGDEAIDVLVDFVALWDLINGPIFRLRGKTVPGLAGPRCTLAKVVRFSLTVCAGNRHG